MRIGIVGCGRNSDYHIGFARAYPGVEIVGLVDTDQTVAKACGAKHNIGGIFSSIKQMVEHARPDVVHVLTPPVTHFALTKEAIELKCHVLVEKPLALTLQEARLLFDTAKQCGVKLCTMHNHLFDPCVVKANELAQSHQLGKVLCIESYYGLNTQIAAFRDYPLPNVLPWIYELPAGVYQDVMPHPLYLLLQYTGRPKDIKVMARSHGTLPNNLPDEIRILIDGDKALGTLSLSFAAQPHLHFVRIYGTQMMVEADLNTMTTVVHRKSALPKAAQKATYNLSESWQLFKSTCSNVFQFLTGKLKPYEGMKILIHRFYDSIQNETPIPVTEEQALNVIETMDEIFRQIKIKPFDFTPIRGEEYGYAIKHKEKVLVTGGTGFLGKRLVEALVADGYSVRVLARKLSDIEPLKNLGVEIFWGDVADRRSLDDAFLGIDVVVHAAAGTSGRKQDCELATVQGTLNILELCERHSTSKLIYIGSCSVYAVADYKRNHVVTEDSPLERFPFKRGEYSASKQKAESYVFEALQKHKVSGVILRPGTIWGPGGELFTPMMGFAVMGKVFVVIGDGQLELPLVYIDNLVEAIIRVMQNKADNTIFNVVDSDKLTKREYIDKIIRPLHPKARVVYFPYWLLYVIVWMQETLVSSLKGNPVFTRYRLISSQKNLSYDNSKMIKLLRWQPKVELSEALDHLINYEKSKL